MHYIHGYAGLLPNAVNIENDNIYWSYDITVPAGESVRLAHYTILADTRAAAEAAAAAVVTTGGFGGEAAAFLSQSEIDSITNFQFDTVAPSVSDIRIASTSWGAAVSSSSLVNDTVGGSLPWINLNTIEIEFNEAVDNPTIDTIRLDRFTDTMPLAPIGVAEKAGSNGTIWVWTFATLATDKFTLIVEGEASDAAPIKDSTGNLLLGGDKSQAFDVVLGDASRDGETTVTDLVVVTSHIGEEPTVASPFDVDGSGDVTVTDLVIVSAKVGEELPSLRQTVQLHVPQIGPGTTSILELNQIGDILENGVDRLLAARLGLTSAEAGWFRNGVTLEIVDLPADQLTQANGMTLQIDADAAGWGWFVDPTPGNHAEFRRASLSGSWWARAGSEAANHVDLLTVVMHELGHMMGLDSELAATHRMMSEQLAPGKRRLPQDVVLAKFDWNDLNRSEDEEDESGQGKNRDRLDSNWYLPRTAT